jgi:hypothetical protein
MIRLIFARFRAVGSAREVLLSMTADQVHFPQRSDNKCRLARFLRSLFWRSVERVWMAGKGETCLVDRPS